MLDREELLRRMGRDAYAELSGAEVLAAGPGEAEVRLPVTDKILNGHGNVHGGVLFTMADYAAAIASNMYGAPTMATNGSISFLRAVRGGHVLVKARTVKPGRRMNFQTVELFDAEGELVATYQGATIAVGSKPDGA